MKIIEVRTSKEKYTINNVEYSSFDKMYYMIKQKGGNRQYFKHSCIVSIIEK